MGILAEITHTWADGSTTDIEVSTDQDVHPDLIDQVASAALRMWRETCTEVEPTHDLGDVAAEFGVDLDGDAP